MPVDAVLVGAVSAIIGSLLTFLVQRKDATTRANDVAVNTLTATIKQLQMHIDTLDRRIVDMEDQIGALSTENLRLLEEIHALRKALVKYDGVAVSD